MSLVLNVEPNWISPYVFACFVTLREKGLAFDAVPLDASKNETRTADYLAKTVTGRVPTLVHDGFGLGESTAIVEYLDEAFPATSVLPKASHDRARCRQLMSWIRSDETAALREERSTHTMFYAPVTTPLSAAGERAAKKLVEVTERAIRPAAPHVFEAWSIIDSELAFILHRLLKNGDPVPAAVKTWAEAQWQRPSVRSFVDLPRPALAP